jgi:hypothetical protein
MGGTGAFDKTQSCATLKARSIMGENESFALCRRDDHKAEESMQICVQHNENLAVLHLLSHKVKSSLPYLCEQSESHEAEILKEIVRAG